MKIKNMSRESLFNNYLSFNFNEKYFDKHVECHDMKEIIAVNKAMQVILKEGYGDRLESTASRILRTYSRPHNYVHTTEVDSFFLHTDYMDARVKEMILDTAKRIKSKKKKLSMDDKIIEGLKSIKPISKNYMNFKVDDRIDIDTLYIVKTANNKCKIYFIDEVSRNKLQACEVSGTRITENLTYKYELDPEVDDEEFNIVNVNDMDGAYGSLKDEPFHINGKRAIYLYDFLHQFENDPEMKKVCSKLLNEISMLNDIRVYDIVKFENKVNSINKINTNKR